MTGSLTMVHQPHFLFFDNFVGHYSRNMPINLTMCILSISLSAASKTFCFVISSKCDESVRYIGMGGDLPLLQHRLFLSALVHICLEEIPAASCYRVHTSALHAPNF